MPKANPSCLRRAVVVAGLALFALAGAIPPTASADDEPGSSLADSAVLPAVEFPDSAPVEDGLELVEPVMPSAPAEATASEAAEVPTDAGDIAADTAASALALAAAPVAAQVDASNVNVSVRIESGGDDDAVTQTNVVDATSDGATSPEVEPVEEATVAADTTPTTTVPTTTADQQQPEPAEAVTTDPTPPRGASSDWNWNWDCASAPAIPPEISRDIALGTVSANAMKWKWNWTCDDVADEGSAESVAIQKRPLNVNVTIRIASPGSNGPVTQVNAATVHVAALLPTPVFEQVAEIATVEVSESPAAGPLVVPTEPLSELVAPLAGDLVPPPEPDEYRIPWVGEIDVGVLLAGPTRSPPPPARARAAPVRRVVTWRPPTGVGSSPAVLSEIVTRHAPRVGRRPAPASRREKVPSRAPAAPGPAVAGAAPGAPGGGVLPLALALPFAVAVLDGARRLWLGRFPRLRGHDGPAPERPG